MLIKPNSQGSRVIQCLPCDGVFTLLHKVPPLILGISKDGPAKLEGGENPRLGTVWVQAKDSGTLPREALGVIWGELERLHLRQGERSPSI
jgi:hypothetical protein